MKNNKIIPYLAGTATLVLPFIAFAQGVRDVIDQILDILDAIIPILFGLALIYFLWALIQYVGAQGNEDKQKEARSQMVYGIIILAVMLGVWGLAYLLLDTFGIAPGGGGVDYPTL